MFLLRRIFALSVLLGVTLSAHAQNSPQLGTDYLKLNQAQPVEAGKRVEVIEFFGYFCPGCNAFEPHFEDWIKQQGDRIVVKRVHVNFHNNVPQQKLYYALEAMGKVNDFQLKTFNAFHIDKNHLSNDAEVLAHIERLGIDKTKFLESYNSFSVMSKVSRSTGLLKDYEIASVPTVVIDGRFSLSPLDLMAKGPKGASGKSNPAILVMDWLVNRVAAERSGANTLPAGKPFVPAKK